MDIRDKEVTVLKKGVYLNAAFSLMWLWTPFIVIFLYTRIAGQVDTKICFFFQVSVVTFATFIYINDKNVLSSAVAFVALSLFNIMGEPFTVLPFAISYLVEVNPMSSSTFFFR